jgi:hypothetical protein
VKSGMMSYVADGSAKQIAFTQTAPTDLGIKPNNSIKPNNNEYEKFCWMNITTKNQRWGGVSRMG